MLKNKYMGLVIFLLILIKNFQTSFIFVPFVWYNPYGNLLECTWDERKSKLNRRRHKIYKHAFSFYANLKC